ncbi:MAG: hypothetical protein ABSA21_11295 [Candidatus Limnocylindrales bacterium]
MTLEVAVIGLYRVVGSLPTLRWPLAGGLLAIFVDLTDLFWMDVLGLGGIPDYQMFDKLADQVYLAVFLIVALRWTGPERTISVVLYAFRFVGFVLFVLSGERALLVLFPNVFEFWFLFIAAFHHFRPALAWTRLQLAVVLVPLAGAKEVQEWALHWARLFDNITFLEALEQIRRWLFGLVGLS